MTESSSALAPDPATLDPIETASRNEIEALHLKRLKWSLKHACENFGISVEVVHHEPGEVARSEGKAQRVVENRGSKLQI